MNQIGQLTVKLAVDKGPAFKLVEMLEEYREGKREFPGYQELLELAGEMTQSLQVQTGESSPDENVERNRQLLLDRSVAGLKKYGVTTERTDLNLSQWLQHLLEELLDAANYIQAAKTYIEKRGEALYIQQCGRAERPHGQD